MVLLACGLPGTGKSTFGRHVSSAHAFAHYDLENHPQGWPMPMLHAVWERSRADFIGELRSRHQRAVLDWGFPPPFLGWICELAAAGCRVVWFGGSIDAARVAFVGRDLGALQRFDDQVDAITHAGLPGNLPVGALTVDAFDSSGGHVDPHVICGRVGVA